MSKTGLYSIFREEADNYQWEKYLEQLEWIELSESERKRAYEAIQYFRQFLGEKFLKKASINHHPFYRELRNSAGVARLRLSRFADLLRSFEHVEGFDSVAQRLRRVSVPDEYIEASTVVETSEGFQKVGFGISFTPTVKIISKKGTVNRYPDIKLTNQETGEDIFVEVSRLRKNFEQIRSENSFDTIWRVIHAAMNHGVIMEKDKETNKIEFRYMLPRAIMLRDLEQEELPDVVQQIIDLVNKVLETDEFQELILKDKIEVAISPMHNHSRVEQWAKERGIRDLVKSPPLPRKATHSARMKIGFKTKRQLPVDKPGILVIPATETLMLYTFGIQSIIEEIRTELEQYPQLLYVVLTSQAGESKEEPLVLRAGEHLFTKITRDDQLTERRVILKNPKFNLRISPSTERLVEKALVCV